MRYSKRLRETMRKWNLFLKLTLVFASCRRVVDVSKSDGFNLGIDFSRPCSRNTNLSRRYVVRNDQFLGGLLRRFFLIPMPRGDNQDQRKLLLATSSNNRLENQGCTRYFEIDDHKSLIGTYLHLGYEFDVNFVWFSQFFARCSLNRSSTSKKW